MQLNYSRDLIGSCHGLICFAINNRPALLWNPSTRKCKKLPPLEFPKENGKTIYAFGYDPLIHNYKVVSVYCYHYRSNKPQVNIHTLVNLRLIFILWAHIHGEGFKISLTGFFGVNQEYSLRAQLIGWYFLIIHMSLFLLIWGKSLTKRFHSLIMEGLAC
jgi:hypothetical protein